MPVRPPRTKVARNPSRNQVGTANRTFPRHSVAIQEKIWMPVGIATAMLAAENKLAERWGMPVVNM